LELAQQFLLLGGILFKELPLRYPMSGGYFQFQAPQLRVIPFREPPKELEGKVSKLVKRIAAAKARDPQANTVTWEKEIDSLLYTFYELTKEEIDVVETPI